jgi:hypothetical protein
MELTESIVNVATRYPGRTPVPAFAASRNKHRIRWDEDMWCYRWHFAVDFNDARRPRAPALGFWVHVCLSTWIFCLSGCAFVPEQIPDEPATGTCQISTPEWKLTVAEINDVMVCQSSGKEAAYCLLTVGLVIPAGSFVVSGSIVIVGNTLHWLEYQGRCEDSFLHQQLSLFRKTFAD